MKYFSRKIIIMLAIFVIIALSYIIKSFFSDKKSPVPQTSSTINMNLSQNTNAASGDETSDWKTLAWDGWIFKYPATWTLETVLYSTPAQEALGKKPEIIGYSIVYMDTQTVNGSIVRSIEIGGRQADCASLGAVKCEQNSHPPVYTTSHDPEVLRVYDLLVSHIQNQNLD